MDFDFPKKRLLAMMLAIGVIQTAGYYLAGSMSCPDAGIAVPQPDTLLYCQSARRIVEGHPFSFFEGAPPSTGNTTVLYPFVLAVPYALGFTGDSLLTGGFILNAIFYLVFLAGWGVVISRFFEKGSARLVAGLLIALSNQQAFCSFSQSDIGLWLAASALFAAGLATGNAWLYGAILILGPWIRPEGMVCVIAAAMVLCGVFVFRRLWPGADKSRSLWPATILILAAFASMAGVFALNYALTGKAGFMSVANKGHFTVLPFANAVERTFVDGVGMFRELFMGMAFRVPRVYYFIPVFSGLFFWYGLLSHDWKRPGTTRLFVWLLACGGGFLTIAMSGWQITNYDRYLAWLMPTMLLFMAEGLCGLSERIGHAVRWVVPSVAVLYSLASAIVIMFAFYGVSVKSDEIRTLSAQANRVLPKDESVGVFGNCGIAYELGNRRCVNVAGIYSVEFMNKTIPARLEKLKNHPELRFGTWFAEGDGGKSPFGPGSEELYGEAIVAGFDGSAFRKANWKPLDEAKGHFAPPGKELKFSVDVGDEDGEAAVRYVTESRLAGCKTDPFIACGRLDGAHGNVIDVGRVIHGWDSMDIDLEAGKTATVVMRTLPRASAMMYRGEDVETKDFSFGNPLLMRARLDGRDVALAECAYATNGFTDVSFEIPSEAVRGGSAKLEIFGDRLTCAYWIYQ